MISVTYCVCFQTKVEFDGGVIIYNPFNGMPCPLDIIITSTKSIMSRMRLKHADIIDLQTDEILVQLDDDEDFT